jgi:hypothetical protein
MDYFCMQDVLKAPKAQGTKMADALEVAALADVDHDGRLRIDEIDAEMTDDDADESGRPVDLEVDEESPDDKNAIDAGSETDERTSDDGPDGYSDEFD